MSPPALLSDAHAPPRLALVTVPIEGHLELRVVIFSQGGGEETGFPEKCSN